MDGRHLKALRFFLELREKEAEQVFRHPPKDFHLYLKHGVPFQPPARGVFVRGKVDLGPVAGLLTFPYYEYLTDKH